MSGSRLALSDIPMGVIRRAAETWNIDARAPRTILLAPARDCANLPQ
jgi:hypothetical protein